MEKLTVERTSATSAEVSDFVLGETSTTRRVFRAEFVRHPSEAEWLVKGALICQRKRASGSWEDSTGLKLSELKSGDAVALRLDSSQTEKLFEALDSLKSVAAKKGIKWGMRKLVVADAADVIEVTDANHRRVIEQLIARKYSKDVWDAIAETDPDLATRLSQSRIQVTREDALRMFQQHLDAGDWTEPQWQEFFWHHQWIFGYGLRYHFLALEKREANYGGESYQGRGKQRGEFLARTQGLTSFSVVVEIKKPETPVFMESGNYRSGVPRFSPEFVSAISQAQVNTRTWDTEGSRRTTDRELLENRRIFTVAPLSILVIGSTAQLRDHERRECFELFRRHVHNPDILCFDELYERAKFIVEMGTETQKPAAEVDETFHTITDEDIPF